ncbi:MAG: haloacid dehalogenase [Cellulomonas sp. 73-92]|uniref:HAD hydrolase-like protein n=1 Tax=Cellulomonas sp. 73-92 TaxID=1895740 RepID=UPI00092837F9|nr:HAD hydrolase-like protein [Cellulomonas sp. 73-92]OJV82947.1 MAG: haloacid dehalogenase [Cellulomonas sp. 73-92]
MTVRPLVLLDLDGTLTDSAPGIVASARVAYAALGLPVPDDATLRTFVGPPLVGSFRAHGVPEARIGQAITAYRAEFAARGMWDNSVFEGIPAALAELRAAGATLLIATSKPTVYAVPIAERFGLAAAVDGVFGAPADLVASDKASVIAAALASLPAVDSRHALMVGDREHDVAGARAHGIDTLGAAWGYAPDGELERAGVVGIVGRPDELAAAVLARLSAA